MSIVSEVVVVGDRTHRSFSELAAPIDDDAGRRNEAMAARERAVAEIVAYSLGEIRKARNVTQNEVARVLGIGQPRVSRIERGESLQLDTLMAYARALGARLEINVIFDDLRVALDISGGR